MEKHVTTTPKTFEVHTFGCKVNYADSMEMEDRLMGFGGQSVSGEAVAPESIVVNTCTVTAAADRQARALVRKLHREHPDAKIIVTGCSAQHESQRYQTLSGVHHVLPIKEQFRLPQVLSWAKEDEIHNDSWISHSKRTRANLKVQDGCNAYCSFCILPYIRGRSSSISLDRLITQMRSFVEQGHKEIVVTGTHVGAYGRDLSPRLRLSDALSSFLTLDPQLRLRISSLEPSGVTPDFLSLVRKEPRIRSHFHIPMQSGSDDVLKRMNRKYKAKTFANKILQLAQTRSILGIGTDVIVGFPGETQDDFEQTRALIESLPFTYLHVFPYSERPGTKAVCHTDDVPVLEKKRRSKILRDISARKQKEFFSSLLGQSFPVLLENRRDAEIFVAFLNIMFLFVLLEPIGSWKVKLRWHLKK
ncbi:MAG: tRNA (N(6)-L-threonylcarbamoyladenosine(37)-C(2))-methylthiotransferase MtaB [Bdellovibrionota bacterium]